MRTSRITPLLLALVVAGLPPAAGLSTASGQAAVVAARPVTLRAVTSTVEVGSRVRLAGRATLPRRSRVVVQHRRAGVAGWSTAGRTRVQAKGRFRFAERVTTKGDRRYRACVVRRGRTACSRPVRIEVVPPRAAVTLLVSGTAPTTLEAGQAVTVSGTASPALVGSGVQLQASYDGMWTTVGTTTVDAASRFTVSGVLPRPGRSVPLRVLAPGSATTRPARAAAGVATVFGWYFLHDGGPLAEVSGNWCPISRTVAGVGHPRSVGFGFNCFDDNVGEALLAGSCTDFVARVGLSDSPDDTTANARYAFTVLTDGAVVFHQPEVAPGQAFDVAVPLVGVQRLRLEGPFVSGTKGLLVVGDARARCAL